MAGSRSMTGLSRRVIALIAVPIAVAGLALAFVLSGSVSWCRFDENQAATGYCAASSGARVSVLAIPCATILTGYLLTLRHGRLTPVLLAAIVALAEGLVELSLGY